MQKWGKDARGKFRFRCKFCKVSRRNKRKDLTQKYKKELFTDWLLGKYLKDEIANKYGVRRRTLTNWFFSYWNEEPVPKLIDISNKVVIIESNRELNFATIKWNRTLLEEQR